MTTPPLRTPTHRRQSSAQLIRDVAVRRIASTRRIVVTSTVGLVAGFAGLVADLTPSYAKRSQARTTTTSELSATRLRLPALATPAELGLTGHDSVSRRRSSPRPSEARSATTSTAASTPAPAPAPVVSGGS